MPFRRRGERRLMIIDDKATTPRQDPQADPVIKADLRPSKEALIDDRARRSRSGSAACSRSAAGATR